MSDIRRQWESVPLATVFDQTGKGGRIPEHGRQSEASAPQAARPAVLNSWKEIASYVGRGVRTMQRWEKDLGFPVRRARGQDHSPVVAYPAEVDEWLRRTFVRRPPSI